MSTLVRLRSLFVPACIALFLIIAAGWYNLFWLPSEHRYLDDRNFRVLNSLSEQLRLTINTFDKMMDNAADSGVTKDGLSAYLQSVAPQLEIPKDGEAVPVIGTDYSDPPKIAVVPDEGTHFLYLAFQRDSDGFVIRTDLDRLIEKLLPPASRSPFDGVLLAQSDGTVIFQKALPGVDVAQINTLEDASGGSQKGKTDTPITVESLSRSSRLEEVMIAGARYRLYSQPLKIPFAPADPEKKPSKAAVAANAKPWVFCGLVRADRFKSESQSISYAYILWLSAAILIVLAVYPFLRLHISSCQERLRAGEVITAAVSACVVVATGTFILLDISYWQYDFNRSAEEQMRKLSAAIDSNFNQEKEKAFDQLTAFYAESSPDSNELRIALRKAVAPPEEQPRLTKNGGTCEPDWSCRAKILSDSAVSGLLESYPHLEYVGWSDSRGQQRVKWTTRRGITPFLNLDDPSIPYYPAVKNALKNPGSPTPVPTQGIATQYSPNTGSNITIFWKLMYEDGTPVSGKVKDEKKVFCASLVTHPISVFDPVIPEGFQFAVIKPDGTVVFHSDHTRNLRENFFAETDQDQTLRSRVLMRAAGPLVARYMGRPHRLYVHPMSSGRDGMWTVVVFRDLHVEETMNLEMLSLASILFLLYATAIAFILLMVHLTRKGQVSATRLWPDSRKAATYRWLVIANGVAASLFFVLAQISSPPALIFYSVFIPAGMIIVNLHALRHPDDPTNTEANSAERPSASWQPRYIGACATLLLVVAVLPCLSFYKVACDFERKAFIKRTQLSLAADADEWEKHARLSYQGIELGQYAGQLLPRLEDQNAANLSASPRIGQGPLFSYHEVLSASISSAQKTDSTSPGATSACGFARMIALQRCVELFLSWSSPIYNEIASDNRYLAEGGSSDSSDSWAWLPTSGGKEMLTLIRYGTDQTVRTISSPWTPFRVPLGSWQWWLSGVALLVTLFLLTRSTLRRLFLLDLVGPSPPEHSAATLDPNSLIAKLPTNLVVIGPGSCRTIAHLLERPEVQVRDICELLGESAALPKAVGESVVTLPVGEPVNRIVQDGRPLVLCDLDRSLDDPDRSQRIRVTLEKVLAKLNSSLVVISRVDPATKAPVGEPELWRTLLDGFVRIDLKSKPAARAGETTEQFEARISADAYYRTRFSSLSKSQRLLLVQLAQEGLVNPNSRHIVSELVEKGLIVRRWGLLTVKDGGFANFLKGAIPPNTLKHLERQGVGASSTSLRTSLLVVGVGVAAFLIYTQGEIFNTWVTYATGLAASLPAFMRVLAILRGKSGGPA